MLLAVLSIVFAVWMAFLVYLYVKTVYPRRSVAPDSSLSAEPGRGADLLVVTTRSVARDHGTGPPL